MPPVMGAAAFLMADLTAIPYGNIAMAAALPAVLCYAVLFNQAERFGRRIEVQAATDPVAAGAGEAARTYQLSPASLLHILPAAGIIWVLMNNDTDSEGAGMLGTALALLVALVLRGPRKTLRHLVEIAPRAAQTVSNLVVAGATLGVVLAVMGSTGLDVKGALAISHVGESSLLLSLLMTAAAAFVLGMGVSTSGVYLITGTLLAPGLVKLGVPLIAAHFFVFYCGMLSMITPPVAFAALAASGLVGASFRATSFEAMKFGWILFLLPFLIVYAPGLLLEGGFLAIARDLLAAVACVAALVVWPGRGATGGRRGLGLVALLAAGAAVFGPLPGGAAMQAGLCLLSLAISAGLLLRHRAAQPA
ncbi:TRAP transporter large permease subunit [Oceanicola sp. S124]|uniref:TRAP transporter large permease subunit n=1 Tax=Oceanicola sp. S124 TaxID=1042378 RepID=UPI000255A6CB|nr:TRAP transporter large permease subunit [Oceanicola sp. S124]